MPKLVRRISQLAVAGAVYNLVTPVVVKAAACDLTITGGAGCAQGPASGTQLSAQIRNVTNTLLFVIGVAAVIMLIVGGLRYIFSAGDSENTKSAKDTILFAVIGIIVAMLALAIVNLVLIKFK